MSTMDKKTVIYGGKNAMKLKGWNDWSGVAAQIKIELGEKAAYSLSAAKKTLEEARDDPQMTGDPQAYVKVGVVGKNLVFRVKSRGVKDLCYDGILIKNYGAAQAKAEELANQGANIPQFTAADASGAKMSGKWFKDSTSDCTVSVAGFKKLTKALADWTKAKAEKKKLATTIKTCRAAQQKLSGGASAKQQKAYQALVQKAVTHCDSVRASADAVYDAAVASYNQLRSVKGPEAANLKTAMETIYIDAQKEMSTQDTQREKILVMLKGVELLSAADDGEEAGGGKWGGMESDAQKKRKKETAGTK